MSWCAKSLPSQAGQYKIQRSGEKLSKYFVTLQKTAEKRRPIF
jgi:hypothetical protein